MLKVRIGIDFGGTKIRAGIVDNNGNIVGKCVSIPTNVSAPKEIIIGNMFAMIQTLIDGCHDIEIQGIGVGCTGPLDNRNGIILDVCNLPTLNYYPLRECIESRFSCKVAIDNDANVFLLGESLFGSAKECSSVLGFTLGTGLGCAYVENKKICHGSHDCTGEIWTSPYKDGIIEDYVSGNGVSQIYKSRTGTTLNTCQIADLARKDDKIAREIWNNFSVDLAYLLSWCVNMFEPEMVVIGGSLMKSSDLFFEEANDKFRKYICKPICDKISVRSPLLEDDGAVIGAAYLV